MTVLFLRLGHLLVPPFLWDFLLRVPELWLEKSQSRHFTLYECA